MRYCLPICVVCVSSHLWTVARQIQFWEILPKSWDSVGPPPLVGPKDQLFPFFNFEGSPKKTIFWEQSPAHKCHDNELPSSLKAPRQKGVTLILWRLILKLLMTHADWSKLKTSLITASNIAAVDPGVPTPSRFFLSARWMSDSRKLPIVSPRLIS